MTLLLIAACSPAPTPPAPGPDLTKIATAAQNAVRLSFAEQPAVPIAPCELQAVGEADVSRELGTTVAVQAPVQLAADKYRYTIFPASENMMADVMSAAQTCPARKVSKVVIPRQGKPFLCRNDVTTTVTVDGPVLKVVTDSVPTAAPPQGEWTVNEQGKLEPPSDLGKPTCGTGVAYGQAILFSITNGIAVQVVKPVDPTSVKGSDEPPAKLSALAETEAMADMRKLLSALS